MSEELQDKFIIREYKDVDYEGIVDFWELTGLGAPERGDNKETIEATIRLGGALYVMEEKGTGKLSGTSWMTYDGRRILLHHFGIRPEFQGNGLSKILLQHSLEFVRQKRCQVKLEVQSSNQKAINLYKKFGFRHLGEYDIYILRDIAIL